MPAGLSLATYQRSPRQTAALSAWTFTGCIPDPGSPAGAKRLLSQNHSSACSATAAVAARAARMKNFFRACGVLNPGGERAGGGADPSNF